MNTVELDPAALDAEADRLLSSAPPELTGETPTAAQPGAGALDPSSQLGQGSWNEVTPGLVAAADIILLPQWHLRTEEKEQLSRAIGDVLDQIFPGGLSDPRWAPYVRLLAVSTAIVFSRIDPKTGKFPPFGPMKRAEDQVTRDGTAADADAREAA